MLVDKFIFFLFLYESKKHPVLGESGQNYLFPFLYKNNPAALKEKSCVRGKEKGFSLLAGFSLITEGFYKVNNLQMFKTFRNENKLGSAT